MSSETAAAVDSCRQSRKRKARAEKDAPAVLIPRICETLQINDEIIIGHRVHRDVASRSGLLAGLDSTAGLAELPEGLSPEDVQLWHAACILDYVPSTEELMTVLKVADVLADADSGPWVSMAASKILNSKWSKQPDPDADALLSHILALRPHLLQSVLASCLETKSFGQLLDTLPQPLLPDLIAAAAAEGSLDIPGDAGDMFFVFLASTVLPSPGLQDLRLRTVRNFNNTTATLLARALAAHPSLTAADLHDTHMTADTLRAFAAGLPPRCQLALCNLQIDAEVNSTSDVTAVADCLRKLPCMCGFNLHMLQKQESVDSAAPLRTTASYAANPAYMPDLQELSVNELAAISGGVPRVSSSRIAPLLSLIRAPCLTSIKLHSDTAALPWAAWVASLRRFPALHQLHITTAAVEIQHPQLSGQSDAEGSVAWPACLQIAEVKCRCFWGALKTAVTVANSAAQSLTSLSISKSSGYPFTCPEDRDGGAGSVLGQLNALWAAVGRCSQLQDLQVSVLCDVDVSGRQELVDEHNAALATCLGQLSQLTCLVLEADQCPCFCVEGGFGGCCLKGDVLAPALQRLTALRHLSVLEGYEELRVVEPDALLRGCAKLTALESLELMGLEAAQLKSVAAMLPALGSLYELALPGYLFTGENEVGMHELMGKYPDIHIVCGDVAK